MPNNDRYYLTCQSTAEKGPAPMPQIAFASPLLPGMTAADRQAMTSFQSGERKAAFEDSRRRAGITRESAWIQTTPNGDFAVVYMEADDLGQAFSTLGRSDAPFDQWFRDHVRQVHGFSLEAGFHAPELILDYREESPSDE
jgi:hypothetical protein